MSMDGLTEQETTSAEYPPAEYAIGLEPFEFKLAEARDMLRRAMLATVDRSSALNLAEFEALFGA